MAQQDEPPKRAFEVTYGHLTWLVVATSIDDAIAKWHEGVDGKACDGYQLASDDEPSGIKRLQYYAVLP